MVWNTPITGILGWFGPVTGPDWLGTAFAAAGALAVLVLTVWRSRARADRQWKAALTTYAEREIAKARRSKPRPASRVGGGTSQADEKLPHRLVPRQ